MNLQSKSRALLLLRPVVLGALLLAAAGCDKRIKNPASEYPVPGREKNLGNFGEIIRGPGEQPAVPSTPRLARRTVRLSIPSSFFPEPVESPTSHSKRGPERAARLEAVLRAFTEGSGVKVVVVHPDLFSKESLQQRPAEIALVSEMDAFRLFQTSTNRLETWGSADVSNASRISVLYQDLLKAVADKSSPDHSPRPDISDYCLPYLWSMVGIGYHSALTENLPLSWQAIFERTPSQGEIRFLKDDRFLIGSAALYMEEKLKTSDQVLRQVLEAGTLTSQDLARLRETEHLLQGYLNDRRLGLANLHQVINRLLSYLQDKASVSVALQIGAETEPGSGAEPRAPRRATNEVAMLEQEKNEKQISMLRTNLGYVFGTATVAELPPRREPCKIEKGQIVAMLKGLESDTPSAAFSREDNAALQQYLSFGSPYEEMSTSAVRQSVALLLSYAQFLPSVAQLKVRWPDLTDECVRTMAESGAVMNLLKRQAFRLLGQESLFYEERALGWKENPWTIVQVSGPWATHVQSQGVGLGTAASQPDPRKTRGNEFRLPEEGTIASIYSLVILRDNQAEPRPRADREVRAVLNYLLRPEVASRVSEIFLHGSTEDDARAFVDRELLNSPAYALPESFQRVRLASSDAETHTVSQATEEELERWFNEVHKAWVALGPSERGRMGAAMNQPIPETAPKPPRFPLGVEVHIGGEGAFQSGSLF